MLHIDVTYGGPLLVRKLGSSVHWGSIFLVPSPLPVARVHLTGIPQKLIATENWKRSHAKLYHSCHVLFMSNAGRLGYNCSCTTSVNDVAHAFIQLLETVDLWGRRYEVFREQAYLVLYRGSCRPQQFKEKKCFEEQPILFSLWTLDPFLCLESYFHIKFYPQNPNTRCFSWSFCL